MQVCIRFDGCGTHSDAKMSLSEELESHLRMAIADRIARGEAPAEARSRAMREFGNMALIAVVSESVGAGSHSSTSGRTSVLPCDSCAVLPASLSPRS